MNARTRAGAVCASVPVRFGWRRRLCAGPGVVWTRSRGHSPDECSAAPPDPHARRPPAPAGMFPGQQRAPGPGAARPPGPAVALPPGRWRPLF